MHTSSHGGARPGAGRHYSYGEPTVQVRVPGSVVPDLMASLSEYRLRKLAAELPLIPVALAPPALELPSFATKVSAGFPSPADDYLEDGIDLNRLLVKNAPATFFYTVENEADSMDLVGIFGGDKLIVDRSIEPKTGHIILAVILGEGATVKKLKLSRSSVQLIPQSSNPTHKPRSLKEGEEALIVGVVTSVIRQFRT